MTVLTLIGCAVIRNGARIYWTHDRKNKSRHFTYNVTLWLVRTTIVAAKTQCVAADCMKILIVAQQCFYGIFMPPAIMKNVNDINTN